MSAKLVRHMSTTPITRTELEVRSNIQQRAEYLATHAPGQLWERVAERVLNYDAYPWKGLDAVVHFHDGPGRPVCIGVAGYTGPILGRHVCGDHHSHGIIRAGQRVK